MQPFVRTGRTQLNLTQCQCCRQPSVKDRLEQHVNCTVSDLVTSSAAYSDLSPSGIVLKFSTKLPSRHLPGSRGSRCQSLYVSTLYEDTPWTVQTLSAAQCLVTYSLRLSSRWRLDSATVLCWAGGSNVVCQQTDQLLSLRHPTDRHSRNVLRFS